MVISIVTSARLAHTLVCSLPRLISIIIFACLIGGASLRCSLGLLTSASLQLSGEREEKKKNGHEIGADAKSNKAKCI